MTIDLDGIKERAEVYAFARRDQGPFNCPVTAAESADDVPELIAEVVRLRTVLAEIATYAEERAAAAEEVGDLFEASLTAIANTARQSIGDTRANP